MRENKIFVVFIGPQGAGKSTLAKILLKKLAYEGFNTCSIRLIDYTIFHRIYIKMLVLLAKSVFAKIFSRLLLFFVFLHLVGLLISIIKFNFYMFTRRCDVIIEDEGFIFKNLADVYFVVNITSSLKLKINCEIMKLFLRLWFITGRMIMNKRAIIIDVEAPYEVLKIRYMRDERKIEDRRYIVFQSSFYKIILNRINAICKNKCQEFFIETTDKNRTLSAIKHIIKIIKDN